MKHPVITGNPVSRAAAGFTLVELIVTMIVVGILAVAILPRFANVSEFEAAGQADRLMALIGYAQKLAIAQRRMIYVDLDTPQLCPSTSSTACAAACGTVIALPGGNFQATRTNIPLSGTLTRQFCFDALGSPWVGAAKLAGQTTLIVSDSSGGVARTILLEYETGHVHVQ